MSRHIIKHWHCTFCQQPKPLTPPVTELEASTERKQCPTCKNNSCVWVEYTPRLPSVPVKESWVIYNPAHDLSAGGAK